MTFLNVLDIRIAWHKVRTYVCIGRDVDPDYLLRSNALGNYIGGGQGLQSCAYCNLGGALLMPIAAQEQTAGPIKLCFRRACVSYTCLLFYMSLAATLCFFSMNMHLHASFPSSFS